jgi:parallel beta-helix repeat protein
MSWRSKIQPDIFIAASNASAKSKGLCNYQCDGTDDEAQIAAAIAEITSGKIKLSEGTFSSLTNVTSIPSNIQIEGCGPATIFNGKFSMVGTVSATQHALASNTGYNNLIHLTAEQAAAYAQGDFVKILDTGADQAAPGTGGSYTGNYEGGIVKTVSGEYVYLEQPLNNLYTTANTAKIAKVTPVSNAKLSNFAMTQAQAGDLIYAYWLKNCEFKDLALDCNLHQGIYAATSLQSTVDHVLVITSHDAINFEISALWNTIQNCEMSGMDGDGVDLALHACHNLVQNVRPHHSISTSQGGIKVEYSSSHNRITDCDLYKSGLHGVWIHDNSEYNVIRGCKIQSSIGASISRGIYITANGNQNSILDCEVFGNYEHGILLSTDCGYNTIARNVVHDNGALGGSHTQDGIVLATRCSYNDIFGNTVFNSPRSEVRVHDAASVGNRIFENRLYGTHDFAVVDVGISTIFRNSGYIAPGEILTFGGSIATLTENAFNSLDNPFGAAVGLLALDIYVSTAATATSPNIDCGIGSGATTDYTTLFDDLPGETIGFYRSTIATPGAQTVPQLWQSGAGNRYLNMSIKDAAATGMAATYVATVMGL